MMCNDKTIPANTPISLGFFYISNPPIAKGWVTFTTEPIWYRHLVPRNWYLYPTVPILCSFACLYVVINVHWFN